MTSLTRSARFLQYDAARDRLDIGVGKFDVNGETALQALKRWRTGQRRLAGSQEQKTVAEALAAGLDHFLHDIGTTGVVADILLHLVEDDDRAGHLTIGRQGVLKGGNKLVGGNVLRFRELRPERGPGLFFAGGEVRVGRQQSFGDQRADVHVVQLTAEIPTFRLDHGTDLVVDTVFPQPDAETRLRGSSREGLPT